MEIKTEADSNDMTECPRGDKPSTGMFGFCCAMLCVSVTYAIARCVSVCRVRVFGRNELKHIFRIFYHRVATPFWFFHIKYYDDILSRLSDGAG